MLEANQIQAPPEWEWSKFEELTVNLDGKRVPVSRGDRAQRQGKYQYYGASGVIDTIDLSTGQKD